LKVTALAEESDTRCKKLARYYLPTEPCTALAEAAATKEDILTVLAESCCECRRDRGTRDLQLAVCGRQVMMAGTSLVGQLGIIWKVIWDEPAKPTSM
jgi:hypothetical protein